MKAKDVEATYTVASVTGRLIGDIVGSPALGAQIVSSLLLPDERPTERNIQSRLREALSSGSIQVKGLGLKEDTAPAKCPGAGQSAVHRGS